MNRRNFLKGASGAVTAVSLSVLPKLAAFPAGGPRVLVLGGRDFFGPTLVEKLIVKGYRVTLFNRGFTNPHMFHQLPWIRGDREIKDGSGLANLKAHLNANNYDWVIDTWQKLPFAVANVAKLMKGKVGAYHYVSSISVYKDKETVGIDENYPLLDVSDVDINARRLTYAQAKTLSEHSLFEQLGDTVTTFRSHGMRSDRTPAKIYEPYWPVRFLRGGEILLPKQDNHVMQVCDVDSMINFMLHCYEQGHNGAFNIAHRTQSFEQYLSDVENVTQQQHQKVWIPANFLAEQDIEPYRDLPFWRPQLKGFYHINVEKAHAAGLKNRPYTSMIKDQLVGYLRRNPANDYLFGARGTISLQKEAQVIHAWRERNVSL